MKFAYSLYIASAIVAGLLSACQPEVIEQVVPSGNARARVEAETAAPQHMFLKIGEDSQSYENGQTVPVLPNQEMKIEPWFWTTNNQGDRVEYPVPDGGTWYAPPGFQFTKQYYYGPNNNWKSGARGYTYTWPNNNGGGTLRVVYNTQYTGYAAYVYIQPLITNW
jgi:hypothetical protein